MATIDDLSVEHVLATWPRLAKFLFAHPELTFCVCEIIGGLQGRIKAGCGVGKALDRCPSISRLPASERAYCRRAAIEDFRRNARNPDLLGHRLVPTIDELIAGDGVVSSPNARTPFEAGEDIRPRFSHVAPVMLCHHAETAGDVVRDVSRRLELRGIETWYAPRNIVNRNQWNSEIHEAASTCRELLLFASRAALISQYVRSEIRIAINNGRRVLTLQLEPGLSDRDFNEANVCLENWNRCNWFEGEDEAIERYIAELNGTF